MINILVFLEDALSTSGLEISQDLKSLLEKKKQLKSLG